MPLRSLLFAPGDDERKLARALESDADAVIADLEDAVAPARKAEARATVAAWAGRPQPGPKRFVRVNAEAALLKSDLEALEALELDGLVLPKATPELAARLGGRPVIAIVESAVGLRGAFDLARVDGVLALLLGSVDLSLDLGLHARPDGLELLWATSQLVVDSAAAETGAPIDGVHVDVRDSDGLEERTRFVRSLGYGGKACIHPAQVEIVNEIFRPTSEERAEAEAVVAAYERALAAGRGVVEREGRMIDAPVAEQARRILAEEAREGGDA